MRNPGPFLLEDVIGVSCTSLAVEAAAAAAAAAKQTTEIPQSSAFLKLHPNGLVAILANQ